MRKVFSVFILLIFCLLLSAVVIAESGTGSQPVRAVITGFEPLDDAGAVTVQYKLALVTLEKYLPAQLSVRLEGGADYQNVPVTWQCVEDYNKAYDVYHFEPVLDGYFLAEGTQAPVVTVYVSGESVIPDFETVEVSDEEEIPALLPGTLRGSAPSYYNSFKANRLPAVRSQAPYNSCWVFSSIGALEADLIADGDAGMDVDLSELHLGYYAYHSYYDEKGCGAGDQHDYTDPDYMNAGGTQDLAITVLSNLICPAAEETIPYTWGNDYKPGPFDGRAFRDVQLENAYKLSARDTDAVKAAIQEHGAVSASVYWKNDYYSYTDNSFYCPKRNFTNHAIMLVGWDDSFSRDRFSAGTPDRDGAWLVRNSWGLDDYGREGYFWLSYADPSFLRDDVYVFDAVSGKYDHCYSYASVPDSLGYYDFDGPVTAVQHFMVDGGEQIYAVGFETKTGNFNVEIEVTTEDGRTAQASKFIVYPGYYTLELSEPIIVAGRSDITLTMYYDGDEIEIYTEHAGTVGYSTETSTGFCGSGGLVLNGVNTGEDGLLKLFTVDYDTGEEGVHINAEHFPDTAFRNYISSSFDTDRNGYLSDDEIAAVTVIDFIPADSAQTRGRSGNTNSFKTPGPVKSLDGISFFTELRTLYCAGHRLTALDISRNTKLQKLYCDGNQITSLDPGNNRELKSLSCTGNPLIELDISNCTDLIALIGDTLPELDMYSVVFSGDGRYLAYDLGIGLTPSFNLGEGLRIETTFPDAVFRSYLADWCDIDGNGQLTDHELSAVKYIDCSGSGDDTDKVASLAGIELFPSLETLLCGDNLLESLDLSSNARLRELDCSVNRLEQLDLGSNPELRILDCHGNPELAGLNLSGCTELQTLDCSGADLTALCLNDFSQLTALNCGGNTSLQALDLTDCSGLRTLSCGSTRVPALDLSNCGNLTELECGSNPALTSVNVYGCSALTSISCNECPRLANLNIRGCDDLKALECRYCSLSRLNLSSCQWLSEISCYGNRFTVIDLRPSYALGAITEYYEPAIDNGIAFYNYEGHKIAFDDGVILVNDTMLINIGEPDLILPDSLKTIGDEAFEAGAFRYVVLSEQTDCIGANAFAGCGNLRCIRIPNSEAAIDDNAFGTLTGIVICGVSGSTAETFAEAYSCVFFPVE